MRRLFFILLFVFSGQSFSIIRLGIQGGISSGNVNANPSFTSNARGGLLIGTALEFGLGGDWNLQLEGFYIQKGFVIPATLSVTETTAHLDYVEFPVLLKYSFDLILFKPFIVTGPYLGIKARAEAVQGSTITPLSTYSSSDLGFTFGGGLEAVLSPMSSLVAALRYDIGLKNLVDTSGISVKNKGLLIMGGFLFGI